MAGVCTFLASNFDHVYMSSVFLVAAGVSSIIRNDCSVYVAPELDVRRINESYRQSMYSINVLTLSVFREPQQYHFHFSFGFVRWRHHFSLRVSPCSLPNYGEVSFFLESLVNKGASCFICGVNGGS